MKKNNIITTIHNKVLKISQYDVTALFPLVLICVSLFFINNFYGTTDIYFIMSNGKEVLTNGIPYEDWVSIHDGLQLTLQQWLFGCVMYLLYCISNFDGIYIFTVLFGIIEGILVYKITMSLTVKNSVIASITTILWAAAFVLNRYALPRPWHISLISVLLVVLISEAYNKNNKHFIWFLPLISIIQSNCHSTFWIVTIGVMCTYYIFNIFDKKISKEYTVTVLISIIFGFINPYEVRGLFEWVIGSGHPLYAHIAELAPPVNAELATIIILIILIFIALFITVYKCKHKIQKNKIPIIIICVGATIGGLVCSRLCLYSITFLSILFATIITLGIRINVGTRSIIQRKDRNKYRVLSGCIVGLCILCISIHLPAMPWSKWHTKGEENVNEYISLIDIKNYLEQNDSQLETKTFFENEMSTEEYIYFCTGLHPYMDGRYEVYIEKLNKKEDIAGKLIEISNTNSIEELQEFIDTYKFDYVISKHANTYFNDLMPDVQGYKAVFETNNPGQGENEYTLYKREE